MIGGEIYIQGNHETLSANLWKTELAEEDVEFLEKLLAKYQLNLNCRKFAKIGARQ